MTQPQPPSTAGTGAHALATGYLSPSTDSLWRWSGDGDVLTWTDGTTIAFRQEVEHVIERLAPHGLPPFGAVAMLLAACRDGWEQSPGREAFLRYAGVFSQWRTGAESGTRLHASQLVFQRVARGIEQVVKGLDAVSRFAPENRQPKEAKAALAEAVFEVSKNKRLSPEESAMVARALAEGVNAERLTLRFSSSEALREFADDADALRDGLPLVSEQSLALRRTTGLDELPKEADLDLAPSERVRRLLAELRGDKELSGLARLAQDLMAAVHVPRSLRQQEELPLGGVSDLSNRGPLDRLLVSELAHDDLTLAVRVAVNEALYLRRESPPRQPPNRRAILIDAGIRMWGVPRVFGVAVSLAMAATADPKAELLVFRAAGPRVERVDLTTRAGLVALLGAVEPAPHPGAAVAPFLSAIGESESQTDAILVTHPAALNDRDFGAALRQADDPELYVATVDGEGQFTLATLTRAGRKPVREAKLSLDAIAGGNESKPQGDGLAGSRLVAKDVDSHLPAIFSVDPFPLRLPHVADPRQARASQRHGLVAVTRDGRLLHWDDPKRAARQLTAMLPAGRPRGIWIDDVAGRVHVLFDQTRGSRCRLVTADLSTGVTATAPVPAKSQGAMSACVRGGVLFLSFRQKYKPEQFTVEAFDLATAAPAGSVSTEDVLARDRFFRRQNRVPGAHGWRALSHDGTGPVFADVSFPGAEDAVRVSPPVMVFDRAGHDGPWAVLGDGRILDGAGKAFPHRFTKLPVAWRFVAVSPDGNRLVVGGFQNHLLDLNAGEGPKTLTADVGEVLLVPQIYWSTRFSPLVVTDFNRVKVIDGMLTLVTPKNEGFRVDTSGGGTLGLVSVGHVGGPAASIPFMRVPPPSQTRIELSVAKWPDGSRAYLDSRGLLHLKSSDAAVPEVSLVLAKGDLAGWSSRGECFGPRQFIPDGCESSPARFSVAIAAFLARLRAP
jgi:hypothetical protein